MTNILLSIKPFYAEKILDGKKNIEFRKANFKFKEIEKVYIYATHPIKKILGYFTIRKIHSDTPSNLWNLFKDKGAISEDNFFSYYRDKDIGFAIEVKDVFKFEKTIDPKHIFPNFIAPQSFFYIDEKINIKINNLEKSLQQ